MYGYRKLTLDMCDLGETCGKHRVARLLKHERIRRQIYSTRDAAKADVFNYIEMFYNPKRRHGTAGDTSPVEFERRHSQRLKSVQGIRGDSDRRTQLNKFCR